MSAMLHKCLKQHRINSQNIAFLRGSCRPGLHAKKLGSSAGTDPESEVMGAMSQSFLKRPRDHCTHRAVNIFIVSPTAAFHHSVTLQEHVAAPTVITRAICAITAGL